MLGKEGMIMAAQSSLKLKKFENVYQCMIKLDLDTKVEDDVQTFELDLFEGLEWLAEMFEKGAIIFSDVRRVDTVHGYHYRVKGKTKFPMSPEVQLLLQCWLNDDPKRVYFNLRRLLMGWTWATSNVFFDENEQKDTEVIIRPAYAIKGKRIIGVNKFRVMVE
jgi:hypothetical protein